MVISTLAKLRFISVSSAVAAARTSVRTLDLNLRLRFRFCPYRQSVDTEENPNIGVFRTEHLVQ